MKRILAATLILSWAPAARADDAAGGAGFIVYSLQFVAPNELGADVSTARGAEPRFLLVWSGQIPLGIFTRADWSGSDSERQWPLMHHRLVYEASLAFGRQRVPGGQEVQHLGGDFRLGYRYRFWHVHRMAPFVGGGTTLETTSGGVRPSLSPEIGLHVGKQRILWPGLQLRLQADFYPSLEPHARSLATVGYTFL
jgi:hypothetical protein